MSEHNEMMAGGLIALADLAALMIDEAPDDEDLTFLVRVMDTFRDWSCVFAPPGEPNGGYPTVEGGAKVYNIEAERAKRGRG